MRVAIDDAQCYIILLHPLYHLPSIKNKQCKLYCILLMYPQLKTSIITHYSNILYRIVVAPIGSTIINDEGEEITIKKTSISGVNSEGMFCDAKMLGWGAGSVGIAAQVPSSFEPGDAPPKTKPGAPKCSGESTIPAVEVKGLYEKKLTKEEKKKLAEEKRKARKAAKEAKKNEA